MLAGREYVNVLAQRGLNIVIVSLEEKISEVADEIRRDHGVQVKTIAVDFRQTDVYDKIKKGLEGLDIAILVNNVGMAYQLATFLRVDNM